MNRNSMVTIALLLAATASASVVGLAGHAHASSVSVATFAPSSYTTTSGSDGGQPVSALAVQDQSGTQNDWNKYVEFAVNAGTGLVYRGYRTYTVPSGIVPATITALHVQANYLGASKAFQAWTWRIYNWRTATYVAIGDNSAAADWSWTQLGFNASGTLPDYVGTGGQIRIEVDSSNTYDNMDLDYEAVTLTSSSGVWKPAPGTTYYWQLNCASGQRAPCVNLSRNVQIYEIDGFDNPAQSVVTLHARGIKAICYMDAGTWENWRTDASRFPASVLGASVNGWPGERWLDIRQRAILAPILEQRAQLCKSKGFDAIDWDNVDGYANNTGFPLSYQDQISFNTFLAAYTHSLGLSVVLKNDLAQVHDLQPIFDLAFDEQCFQYSECNQELPFISAGKAVLEVEYTLAPSQFCTQARSLKLSSVRTDLGADGAIWLPC